MGNELGTVTETPVPGTVTGTVPGTEAAMREQGKLATPPPAYAVARVTDVTQDASVEVLRGMGNGEDAVRCGIMAG
jgi:hypothetical protein